MEYIKPNGIIQTSIETSYGKIDAKVRLSEKDNGTLTSIKLKLSKDDIEKILKAYFSKGVHAYELPNRCQYHRVVFLSREEKRKVNFRHALENTMNSIDNLDFNKLTIDVENA